VFPWAFPGAFGEVVEEPEQPPLEPPPAVVLDRLKGRAGAGPTHQIVSDTQIVSLRTATGKQIDQYLGEDQVTLSWSRERNETSKFETTIPSSMTYTGKLPDIVPWLHWIDVWDEKGRDLLWTGPVTSFTGNRRDMSISARDISAFTTKTRNKVRKRWDGTDPAVIAGEHYTRMIEHHGLNVRPLVRLDPLGDRFDFRSSSDENMMDAVMDDLTNLGLVWTIVNGVPLLGPWSRDPVTVLGEDDFMGDGITLTRDGTRSYNDILLRSGNAKTYAKVPMAGLALQQIVNVDSMFGVSNTNRATNTYAAWAAKIRDGISIPGGTILHPQAPITIEQLIPTARVTVQAYGSLYLMEIVSVEVTTDQGNCQVGVTMEAVDDELPELVELQSQQQNAGLNSGLA